MQNTFFETPNKSDLNPIRPYLSSGGKYVPPANGVKFGNRKTLIGQPPWPDFACVYIKFTYIFI